MSDSTYDVEAKQIATNAMSAAARLDLVTEGRMYNLFRTFFQEAEEVRRWNVWTSINWDAVRTNPPSELVEAVIDSYCEDLFLPDYSSRALHLLRASRGRAWFLTRWSYEEGKHMLALNEWLQRSGAYSDSDLREITEAHLQTYRWEPMYQDGVAVFTDMLLWELKEITRFEALRSHALRADDPALVEALDFVLTDEKAHRDFFRAALVISADVYSDKIEDAMERVATAQKYPGGAAALRNALDLVAA